MIDAFSFTAINRFTTLTELANFFVSLYSVYAIYAVGLTYFVDGGMLAVL